MVWPICWMMTGARPSVGSSSIRKRAPVRRIRAIASICCSPPDNLVPWLLSRSFRFGNRSKICSSDRPPLRTTGGSSRFSRTSRLAKIPRSSGQNATPMRAILSDVARIISLSSKRTEPVRLPMIPITDFKRRGLSGAVAAEQRDHLAGVHVEIDAVQDVGLAVPGLQILNRQYRRAGARRDAASQWRPRPFSNQP